jgi:hypothetical protein
MTRAEYFLSPHLLSILNCPAIIIPNFSSSVNILIPGDRNDRSISSFPVLTASLRYSVSANYKYTHVWDNVSDLSAADEPSRPPMITVTQEGQTLQRTGGSTAVHTAAPNGTALPCPALSCPVLFFLLLSCHLHLFSSSSPS